MTCTGIAFIFVYITCQQPSPPPTTAGATFCTVYKPIYWSKTDTRETKEQVDSNNRVWKRLCSTPKK
jgi:hypothetical protein